MTRGRPLHPDVLTPAEWQVLFFLRKGMSYRQIAEAMGMPVDSVETRLVRAMRQLRTALKDRVL